MRHSRASSAAALTGGAPAHRTWDTSQTTTTLQHRMWNSIPVPIAMAHCHTRRRALYTTPGARHRIVVYGAGRPASYGRIRCRAPGVVWLHTVPGARRRIRSSLELLLQYYFVLSGFEMESSKSWWWPQGLGFLHSSFFRWQGAIWIVFLGSWFFVFIGNEVSESSSLQAEVF